MEINISRQSDWSAFEKVFAKDGEYDSEFNLPRRWNGKDFYADLHGLLDKYIEKLESDVGENDSLIIDDAMEVCKRVLEIVRIYLHGYPARAYNCMKNMMELLNEYPMFMRDTVSKLSNSIGNLYRMTVVEENTNDRSRVFHAPYSLRIRTGTCRYSIAGYPCLYVADSIELCEHEMQYFKKKKNAIASKFRLNGTFDGIIKILDFAFRPQDLLEQNAEAEGCNGSENAGIRTRRMFVEGDKYIRTPDSYMRWYPLIAACSYVRTNRDGSFAPEYIVPQLLTQYLRDNNDSDIVGVRYFSCFSEKASEKGLNYVFTTSGDSLLLKREIKPFCPILNEAFLLTEPKCIHDYVDCDGLEKGLENKRISSAFPLTRDEFRGESKADLPIDLMCLPAMSFKDCSSLNTIVLHEGVEEIGNSAFENCVNLQELTIPASVKRIGNAIFCGFSGPKKLDVHKDNASYYSEGNCIIEKESKRFVAGIKLENCTGHIPEGVKCIGDGALSECKILKKIEFPKALEVIEPGAFFACEGIEELELPDNVITIGAWAFAGCTALKAIELPKKLERIGEGAFASCKSIERAIIPDKLTTIAKQAFFSCTKMVELKVLNGVERIGFGAFANCSKLKEIHLPESLKEIHTLAFGGCSSLTDIHYDGNMVQWNIMRRSGLWIEDNRQFTIHCKDGDIVH
jgi:hypothetical protein